MIEQILYWIEQWFFCKAGIQLSVSKVWFCFQMSPNVDQSEVRFGGPILQREVDFSLQAIEKVKGNESSWNYLNGWVLKSSVCWAWDNQLTFSFNGLVSKKNKSWSLQGGDSSWAQPLDWVKIISSKIFRQNNLLEGIFVQTIACF